MVGVDVCVGVVDPAVTAKLAVTVTPAAVVCIEWPPSGAVGTTAVAENDPLPEVVNVASTPPVLPHVTTPLTRDAKPLPITFTLVPTGPETGESEIDACLGGAAVANAGGRMNEMRTASATRVARREGFMLRPGNPMPRR
jgi:hypothetical protein